MGGMATFPRMMGLSPEELMGPSANDTMAVPTPSQMAPVDPQHAMTAPLGPTHDAMSTLLGAVQGGGAAGAPGAAPAGPKEAPKQMAAKPSPLEQQEEHAQNRLMADYAKDAATPTTFGGKLLHALSHATGGDTRRQWEENELSKGIQGIEAEKSKEGLEGATAGHLNAETPEIAPDAASKRALEGAQTGEADARTAQLGNQMEVHDTEQGPLLINKQTGAAQHIDVDGQPVGPKMKLTQSQPIDGPDGKPHTYMLDEKGNKVVDLGQHYERPITVNAGQSEKNLWSVPQPDGSHKVVSLRAGDTIPSGAVSLSGQSSENSKAGSADAPTVAALKFANDYLQSGAFTGPSDEALQDQFFQLAKPSTGFRMNQAQISQLHDMASWMDSWKGRAYHAINGTWFAPEQRAQIVKTMNDLATSKGMATSTSQSGGGAPPAGAKVRDYTQVGKP